MLKWKKALGFTNGRTVTEIAGIAIHFITKVGRTKSRRTGESPRWWLYEPGELRKVVRITVLTTFRTYSDEPPARPRLSIGSGPALGYVGGVTFTGTNTDTLSRTNIAAVAEAGSIPLAGVVPYFAGV